jgi:DNA repair exonuclease SbcCD ATPase subunit
MYIKFKSIKFKNFLSYGNGWTTLNFNNKLNLINAQNGAGKSTIIDAISFALFGKPYRDIKMKSLVNYINKKHLEVEIQFDIGKDSYRMLRGLAPSKFELYKNDEMVEALSSKKLNQIEIDKLLGVKYLLFKNVMCIGAISNVPFFSMCLSDRRELLETIFGLTSIRDMLDEVKERRSNDNITIKTMTATMSGIDSSVSDLVRLVADMEQKSRNFETNKAERLDRVKGHIEQQKSELEKHESNIKKCEEKCAELENDFSELQSVETRISERLTPLADHRAKVNSLRKIYEFRDKNQCPICGTDFCSDHAKEYFDGIRAEIEMEQGFYDTLNEKQKADEESAEKMRNSKEFYEKVKSRISSEQTAIDGLVRGIEYDEKQYTDIKSESNQFDPSEQRKRIEEYRSQLQICRKTIDEASERFAIDTDLVTILSDSGIKRYFFEEIVPILNIKINEYIKKFGLNVEVIFDNMLEYTITRGAFEMEYNGLSNGEKTRVNVAMLLTFYDIAKQLSNWSSSILFMDEIFDSGIDSEGITDFLKELITMIHEDSDLGVYLISHKLNDLNFSQMQCKYETIKVQKKGCFSQLIKG